MTGIVDRIENNIVVIEINVKKNNSKTKSREEYIKEITKDMWE